LCWVTPRKADEPRVKPWLCRRMAMTSSLMGTWSRQSSSGAYLAGSPSGARHWVLVRGYDKFV